MIRRHLLHGLVSVVVVGLACTRPPAGLTHDRAVNAMDEGRYDLARLLLAEHLETSPKDAESLRLAARAWMAGALQSPSHAAGYWRALLETRPTDAEAHRELAYGHMLQGDYDRALSHLESVADTEETDRLRGRILLQFDLAAALEFAEERIDAGSEANLHLTAAQACELLGRSEEAHRWALLAVDREPLAAAGHYLLSRALQRMGKADEAVREARIHAILQELSVPSGTTRGTPIERLRSVDELTALFDPVPHQLLRLRLDVLSESGMRERGRTLLSEALADPDRWGASRGQLALWGERLGALSVAREALEEEIAVTEDRAVLRALRHRLARVYREEDPEKAVAFLEAALGQEPAAASHHCMLGELLLELERPAPAEHALRRSLALAPWRGGCRVALARHLHAQGEREAVSRLLEEAPEKDRRVTRFREQFGYQEVVDE